MSELPTSLLLHFEAIRKCNEGDLSTSTSAIDLITKAATKCLTGRELEMQDEGMNYSLGGMKRDGEGFHRDIQNSGQFKTCEWFISGIFRVIFLDTVGCG